MPATEKSRISHHLKIYLLVALAIVVTVVIAAEYTLHHASPILRQRVIQELSTRFDSQVQLGQFDVSLNKGIDVQGKNLSLRSNLYPDLPPQISIGQFSFHTEIMDLFRRPMHIHLVQLHGLVIQIPPKGQRSATPRARKHHAKIHIVLDRIVCGDTSLVLLTDNPNKVPLQFKIRALTLQSVGSKKPMHFDAHLINPKPIGDIASQGTFGPWDADHPHNTPVDGAYSFTNADLSTIKGIGGILSSKGRFKGPLDTLAVDGETDTPDFSLNVSGHKVALHTEFHAVVDGTNGDTYLQPVHAHFLDSDVTATGSVVRPSGGQKGHDIELNVVTVNARIQDMLLLGAKTMPPVMTGSLHLKAKLELPPGPISVMDRIRLQGGFAVDHALFNNFHIQKGMDELSLRGLGRVDQAKQISQEQASSDIRLPDTAASLHGNFSLANRKLTFPQLVCSVPGAQIALTGTYALDGKVFNFVGHARMQAHISSIVGGWKGRLLSPLDPFFAKGGAGTDIPIKITGTQSEPHFGLNFRR